jgi:hypothetical protein
MSGTFTLSAREYVLRDIQYILWIYEPNKLDGSQYLSYIRYFVLVLVKDEMRMKTYPQPKQIEAT